MMHPPEDDNFLSRWSRRKTLVRQGVTPVAPAPPLAPALPPLPVQPPLRPADGAARPPAAEAAAPAECPADAAQEPAPAPLQRPLPQPTLEDVQALTPESDFSRFVAPGVDPQLKNLALKKLFADPHYNVMDGLDTYIADYNTPDPLPKSVLRQMVQARMLGLLDDELEEQPVAADVATQPAPPLSASEPDPARDGQAQAPLALAEPGLPEEIHESVAGAPGRLPVDGAPADEVGALAPSARAGAQPDADSPNSAN